MRNAGIGGESDIQGEQTIVNKGSDTTIKKKNINKRRQHTTQQRNNYNLSLYTTRQKDTAKK